MDEYLLYTDASTDMPAHVYSEYDIRIIPMEYSINGVSKLFNTEDPQHDAICEELYTAQRHGADVHTSQITPYSYVEKWTPELKAGHDILYISFSSGMSATYDNALMAVSQLKEEFPERTVRVVDSKAATCGQGVLTHSAAINRAAGMSLEENALWLESKVPYLCHRFTVGDLNYLHKGGRVSAAVAIIGSVLSIKPILIIDDEGKLQVVDKARGRNAAKKSLVSDYVKEQGVPDVPKLVYIGHSAQYDEAEKLMEMVKKIVEPGTVVEMMCQSPIIGAHTGTDFFSVCGWGMHRKIERN